MDFCAAGPVGRPTPASPARGDAIVLFVPLQVETLPPRPEEGADTGVETGGASNSHCSSGGMMDIINDKCAQLGVYGIFGNSEICADTIEFYFSQSVVSLFELLSTRSLLPRVFPTLQKRIEERECSTPSLEHASHPTNFSSAVHRAGAVVKMRPLECFDLRVSSASCEGGAGCGCLSLELLQPTLLAECVDKCIFNKKIVNMYV
jgi:hypothetical protein